MSVPQPLFYFGAMSPYSWFAAERISEVLPEARWRGVLLGAVFKSAGRTSWGLTERRAEGMADCEARAAEHGLGPIRWPDPWPTSDLLVARGMVHAESRELLAPFALAAMRLAFLEGADLAQAGTIIEAARRSGIPEAEMAAALEDEQVKQRLRIVTDEAIQAGVFGAPSVCLGEDLYWGDDSLEQAAHAYRALRAI
jgi:2-hydroxychromene-2-carboxylate isomerase